MGYEEERDFFREQKFLEPEDRLEVEVVGRLVEQQQVRLAGEGATEERTAFQPAREFLEFGLSCELQMLDEGVHTHIALPILLVLGLPAQAGRDDVDDRAAHVDWNFLVESRENRTGLAEDIARVGFYFTRDDTHEGGFARAIAPEQADAFAGIDLEVDFIQDRRATEAEIHVKQTERGT